MAIHKEDSQVTLILNHLKSGKEINPKEAIVKYGCLRLGAIIFILKEEGHRISSRLHYFKTEAGKTKHYAVYKLKEN